MLGRVHIRQVQGNGESRIGANALAGLIYIKTKDPTDKFEGTSELTIGSYGTKSTGVAFGGPLKVNNDLSYRLVLRKDKSNGYRKNLYLNKSTNQFFCTTQEFKEDGTNKVNIYSLNGQPISSDDIYASIGKRDLLMQDSICFFHLEASQKQAP